MCRLSFHPSDRPWVASCIYTTSIGTILAAFTKHNSRIFAHLTITTEQKGVRMYFPASHRDKLISSTPLKEILFSFSESLCSYSQSGWFLFESRRREKEKRASVLIGNSLQNCGSYRDRCRTLIGKGIWWGFRDGIPWLTIVDISSRKHPCWSDTRGCPLTSDNDAINPERQNIALWVYFLLPALKRKTLKKDSHRKRGKRWTCWKKKNFCWWRPVWESFECLHVNRMQRFCRTKQIFFLSFLVIFSFHFFSSISNKYAKQQEDHRSEINFT